MKALELAIAESELPNLVRNQLTELVLDDSFAGLIRADDAGTLAATLQSDVYTLMLKLVPIAKTYAYPPISQYFVGAVVLGNSGDLIFGANVEFSSLALNNTIHAEQAAVLHACQRGETGISAIAVNGSPCGHCRQFLTELSNPDLVVITPQTEVQPLSDWLPYAFTPSSLGNTANFMASTDHGFSVEVGIDEADELCMAALQAANRSYAPYSKNWAGTAVRLKDGEIIAAPYVENAAFNPSVTPLHSVLVLMRIWMIDWSEIESALLVESMDTSCSQNMATQHLLSTLGEIPLQTLHI